MQTSALPRNHPRTDRIHAIWKRACLKFKDAAFAARLTGDQLDQITPTSPDWYPLSELNRRAALSMACWNNRCMKLARAEIHTLVSPVVRHA